MVQSTIMLSSLIDNFKKKRKQNSWHFLSFPIASVLRSSVHWAYRDMVSVAYNTLCLSPQYPFRLRKGMMSVISITQKKESSRSNSTIRKTVTWLDRRNVSMGQFFWIFTYYFKIVIMYQMQLEKGKHIGEDGYSWARVMHSCCEDGIAHILGP